LKDAEARDYAIDALEGLARELTGAIEHQRELDLSDYIGRMLAAADRLEQERDDDDDRLTVLEETVTELDDRVAFLTTKVLGGVPAVGVVPLDGPELERDGDGIDRVLVEQNVDRARRGLPLLRRTIRLS
jgi:hypothetical protein